MHGLINKAIQSFTSDTYGSARWLGVAEAAGLGFTDFEAMLVYADRLTQNVIAALVQDLGRCRQDVLEDIGTYLVSHPHVEALRRLLRFGGEDYVEFLHSLDDLPDRARLAVADLHLPELELRDHAAGQFSLTCQPGIPGFGHVLMGMLRAMADDYGALVTLSHEGGDGQADVIAIIVVEQAFARGRDFDLGARAG